MPILLFAFIWFVASMAFGLWAGLFATIALLVFVAGISGRGQ